MATIAPPLMPVTTSNVGRVPECDQPTSTPALYAAYCPPPLSSRAFFGATAACPCLYASA